MKSRKPRVMPNKQCANIECNRWIYRNKSEIRQSKSGRFYCCRSCKSKDSKKIIIELEMEPTSIKHFCIGQALYIKAIYLYQKRLVVKQ